MRVLVVANPASGRRRAVRRARRAAAILRDAGWEPELAVTRAPGHARALVAEAAPKVDRVLVSGGDGTINEVASALAQSETPLGILPSGRGNDLARALGLPAGLEASVAAFMKGVVRSMDLARVGDRWLCTVLGIGFDAHVADRVSRGLWRFAGGWSYTLGVLAHLHRYECPMMTIAGAFGERRERCFLAAVGNTGVYGGGVRIAPEARDDDGALDVCVIRDGPRGRMLGLLPRAFSGSHVGAPGVEMLRSPTVRVETDRPTPIVLDGESAGVTPVTIETVPGALRVLVPS